jgi:ribonucleoside-triphosphate reductase
MPVGYTDDPFEALEHQEPFQQRYTGGTVFHLYMGERISSAEACKKLVRMVLIRFRIPYITVTPTFSICPKHGYLAGENPFCPDCDGEKLADKGILNINPESLASLSVDERQPCEVWTRVMGYHRPVSQFNRGKQSEFHERRFFIEKNPAFRTTS